MAVADRIMTLVAEAKPESLPSVQGRALASCSQAATKAAGVAFRAPEVRVVTKNRTNHVSYLVLCTSAPTYSNRLDVSDQFKKFEFNACLTTTV